MKTEDVLEEVAQYFEDDTDDTGLYVKSFDDCTIDSGLNVKLQRIDVWYDPIEECFDLTTNNNGKTITTFYNDDIKALDITKKVFSAVGSDFTVFCN